MKKYFALILICLFLIPGISFAQRYRYDVEKEKSGTEKSGAEKNDSRYRYKMQDRKSYRYRYKNNYNLNRKYPEKTYSTETSSPNFSIELNGGQSAFEARVLTTWYILPSTISFGMNGLASSEDFYVISSDLTVGNKMFDQKLSLDIGLKGLGGQAEKGNNDATMAALSFLLRAIYDIPDIEVTYNRYLDFELFGEFCAAPSPVCFGDTDQYFEMRTGLGINLTENKQNTIIAGYRYIKADFDDGKNQWDKTNDSFFFGYKIKF